MRLELHDALDQINEIRGQLARTETFRGYRAASVAGTALIACATALLQPTLIGAPGRSPLAYVVLWSAAAVFCAIGTGAQILHGYLQCRSRLQRATTRTVIGQLMPPLFAGAAVSWVFALHHTEFVSLLPGLWALFVSLGVFASRRYLPRSIGWVGLYYLAAGSLILEFLSGSAALSPWVMGATFGIGQMAAAIVLYWNLERREEEDI